jgi:HEPN domain-containing protein
MADSLDVLKWIRRAQEDFDVATREAGRFRPPIETVCYLCQQCAEKILKAYTIAQTNTRTRTHELEELLNECIPYLADFENLRDNCSDLSPYMTVARYPAVIEPTEYHMKQALKDASRILEFTKSKLEKLGYVLQTQTE